jgi:hypothetical protein
MNAIKRISRTVIAGSFALSLLFPSLVSAEPSSSPGTWHGALSGVGFLLKIWNTGDQANATITFDSLAEPENLKYLGSKSGTDYFFRSLDRAAVSIYCDGAITQLSYFERGTVRTVMLTKK